MVLNAGQVVAGYTIEAVLGAGGMGTVYRARNPSLPRSDALKVLSAELSQDPHFRARFEREAELASTLDHPNIVTVYARGETDGSLWIAMQYVAGSDADKEMERGRMTPQRAVIVLVEVAKALDYAHRGGLLHRDVKPANFLLAHRDERIFLADFGIARALDDAVGLTQTGMVMASVAYASPESLSGETTDHRSDIYSLGCSLFRMLTGKSPYQRTGGMAAVAAAHLFEPPPRATDVAPALPAAFDAVIARAMAKNPAERYQSAGELAAGAARALNETTEAVRITPAAAYPQPWPADRTPPPQWANTRGSGANPYPERTPPPQPYFSAPAPHTPPPRRSRTRTIAVAATVVALVAAVGLGVWLWPDNNTATPTYQAQTIIHQMGTTDLATQPRAVAAIGPGDAEAVLSLGVQPVAIVNPTGALPGWEQALVVGDVHVLPDPNTEAIAATKPDLIIDTGPIDQAAYNALKAIAPTITRPPSTNDWTWQTQLTWIGRILGLADQAKKLIDTADSQQADLRTQHPAFNGRSIEVVTVSDAGVTAALSTSAAARYLVGLGFRYPTDLTPAAREAATDTRAIPDPDQLNASPTDVRVVLRTDAAAGGGNYNGLPPAFTAYHGVTVIVDDPAVIAALSNPGYAGTEYLNTSLVKTLTSQVR